MRRRWKACSVLGALASGVTAWLILSAPGPVELALYEVDDLVYSLDSPGVDISLATDPYPYYPPRLTGMELAETMRRVLPKLSETQDGETIEFYYRYLIVRSTPAKRAGVRALLGFYRVRNRFLTGLAKLGLRVQWD
jgi:hypothetical protein